MRGLVAAVVLGCLGLGGCASWQEAFKGTETIDIWDDRSAGADANRLSRHAAALSDAQSLVGRVPTGDYWPAIVWERLDAAPDCNPARQPACLPRWSYDLQLVERPSRQNGDDQKRAPSDAATSPPFTLAASDTQLVEPLTQQVYNRLVVEHVRERVVQIDHLCLGYFSGLERLASGSNATRDGIGILTNYGSILLALSESATKPLAILAGTRAALDGTLNAAETLLLLNPAPMQTYRLVKARQEQQIADARIDGLTRYTDAAAFVEAYAYACTPLGIRHIISDTIDDEVRRIDPKETSDGGQVLLGQIVRAVNADEDAEQAYGGAPLATLTSQDAAYLALLLEHWTCAAESCPLSQEILFAAAPATLKPLLTAPTENARGQLKISDLTRRQLVQLLGALGVVQPSFNTLKQQTLTQLTPPPQPEPREEEEDSNGDDDGEGQDDEGAEAPTGGGQTPPPTEGSGSGG